MDLQHQPVLDAHPRHLGQHLARNSSRSPASAVPLRTWRTAPPPRPGQVGGGGARVAVVARRGAHLLEESPPLPMRVEIALPASRIAPSDVGQPVELGQKVRLVGVDDGIGPVGRHHAPAPAGLLYGLVPAQIVGRPVGGGDHLELEALEQRPRQEVRPREARRDAVIIFVGGKRRQRLGEPEQVRERRVEPQPRRRAAEQMVVFGKAPPDGAPIAFGQPAILARHAQRAQIHPLAHQHARHIMVGHDQQLRRVGKWRVFGIPARLGVPVRADQRQVADALEQIARDVAGRGVGGKQAVVVQHGGRSGGREQLVWKLLPPGQAAVTVWFKKPEAALLRGKAGRPRSIMIVRGHRRNVPVADRFQVFSLC